MNALLQKISALVKGEREAMIARHRAEKEEFEKATQLLNGSSNGHAKPHRVVTKAKPAKVRNLDAATVRAIRKAWRTEKDTTSKAKFCERWAKKCNMSSATMYNVVNRKVHRGIR